MPPPTKIPTRAQILQRINAGPARFCELAGSLKHNNPARLAARTHCERLVAEGLILAVHIGLRPHFIANTEEARKQAIRQHIRESSRHDPATGCTVWTGYVDEMRGPVMRQKLINNGSGVNVRRWLFQELIGRELRGTEESVKMKSRCDPDCIDETHMVRKTRSQLLRGIPKSITAKIANQKRMQQHRGKNPNAVAIIRSSDKSNAQLAKELDMTASNVWKIRTRKTFRLQQSPFSGLGARA